MADKPTFEIPDTVREMAERNVEQARSAYGQFMTMARQAQDMVAQSSSVMAENAREVQERAFRYAQDNVDASFNFAADLAKARDLKEYLEIQARFAQAQMKSYTEQAQELARLMAEASQKSTGRR
jgi:phasin